YPDIFAKPFPVKLQWAGPDWPPQFVPSVVVPYGQFPQDPALFWKPNYPAFRQQDGSDYAPLVVTFQFTAALLDRFPDRFARGYGADLAPYGGGASPFVPIVPAQYGAFPQYPDIFVKAFSAKLQRFQDYAPLAIALPTPGWQFQWPDLYRKPFAAKLQWQ